MAEEEGPQKWSVKMGSCRRRVKTCPESQATSQMNAATNFALPFSQDVMHIQAYDLHFDRLEARLSQDKMIDLEGCARWKPVLSCELNAILKILHLN